MTARELAAKLMDRTRWPASRLAAHQRERLDALLRHAVANSRYYRRVLGTGAEGAPLAALPTLTKAALMEHFDDIVTDGRLSLEAAEARLAAQATDAQDPPAGDPHAGPQAGGPQAGDPQAGPRAGDIAGYRVFATAGSTGLRGIFAYSPAEFGIWLAALLRMLLVMGVTPDMRVAPVGAPSPAHISRQMLAGLTTGRPSGAPELAVTTPLPRMVAALNAYQPDAIPTYASTAALLAEEQLAGRLHIAPAMVATGAEPLAGDMRQRIRDAWGREPHQSYLATEAPLLASTCPSQAGMHLWEDLALIEVVDAHDQPVPPGVPGHKVLVTNLVNYTQPLIRYELSDSVTLAAGPNPAGFPFRRLAGVEGRSDDIVTLPAEGGGTAAVHPLRLRAPFTAFREVTQYQVSQDAGGFAVRVVLRPEAPADTTERVRAALARAVRAAGALPPPITVTPVGKIDREGGHAAKFKLIKARPRAE